MSSYAQRRARLLAQMQERGGGIAILPTSQEIMRNGDSSFPFRADSNFYYLSGFTEPESWLVLRIGAKGPGQSYLFCREKNVEREIWDGFRYGPQDACASFGFDQAWTVQEMDQQMPKLLANANALFYPSGRQLEAKIQAWCDGVRADWRSGNSVPEQMYDLDSLLAEMRLFKDSEEIQLMQRAAGISCHAHARAMRAAKAGMFEYEIEAELLYEFRRQGAQAPAYTPIVAAGKNACILHYSANNAKSCDGDLILIDAGCELDGYAADITRTWPVNGRFSGPQKALYELVLAAQEAALQQARVGKQYMDGHEAAVKVLAQGMLDLQLLDANKVGNLQDVIDKQAYRKFYMHGTGHWLGLDVHDAGHYHQSGSIESGKTRPYRHLQENMVLTIEPGIYVRPAEGVPEQFWDIGIRIEDDVLITADGPRVLSQEAPKSVSEIEALMRVA